MRGHIHAELMAQYAEDARETDKPWERWEYLPRGRSEWEKCTVGIAWPEAFQFRRKPRTITINGREVPEPMLVEPDLLSEYWVVFICGTEIFSCEIWNNDNIDKLWLSRGLCHSTKEAAIAHAEALLSFTEAK